MRPARIERIVSRMAHLVVLLVLALAPLAAPAAVDDPAVVLERRVKAALIYRLTNYVEWPESSFPAPSAPFSIEIAGADALAAELMDFAAGKRVLDRPLSVRRRAGGEQPRPAHVLFIGREESGQLASLIRAAPPNALVVTESENALRHGSVVNFIVVDGQVRMEISLQAAQKRGLRLSSRLLSVAQTVRSGGP